jgi:hypothetical protein
MKREKCFNVFVFFACLLVFESCAAGRAAVVDNAGYGKAEGAVEALGSILDASERRLGAGVRALGDVEGAVERIDANLRLYFEEVDKLRGEIDALRKRIEGAGKNDSGSGYNSGGDDGG